MVHARHVLNTLKRQTQRLAVLILAQEEIDSPRPVPAHHVKTTCLSRLIVEPRSANKYSAKMVTQNRLTMLFRLMDNARSALTTSRPMLTRDHVFQVPSPRLSQKLNGSCKKMVPPRNASMPSQMLPKRRRSTILITMLNAKTPFVRLMLLPMLS